MRSSKLNIKFIILFILGISWSSVLLAESPKFEIPPANVLNVWENVGSPSFTNNPGYLAPMVIGSNDVPYVAYSDTTNGIKLNVKKFDGSTWTTVGSPNFSASRASYISLAVDGTDTLYVAYSDYANGSKITVQRYTGTGDWAVVGSVGFSTGNASYISIAIDDSHRPYVVYSEYYSDATTVKVYNGSAWVNVGTPIADYKGSNTIEIDNANNPYISYTDGSSDIRPTVLKYADSNWTSVGPGRFSDAKVDGLKMALDHTNVPYVIFQDYAEHQYATVMKYNGSDWTAVGGAGFSGSYVSHGSLDIAADSANIPYVVYDSGLCTGATVQKFNGTEWENVGEPCFASDYSNFASIALDSEDVPYMAYMNNNERKTSMMKGTKYLKFDVAENITEIGDINASDSDGDPVTYSITGAESSFFHIDSTTGELSFIIAPDYETPLDGDGDNAYDFTVHATADGETVNSLVRVTVLDAGEIISDGGGDTASISLDENIAAVTSILGGGELTLSGTDAAYFHINADTLELIFNTIPDYETDKTSYEVTVTAVGNGQSDTQTLFITINDIDEVPEIQLQPVWTSVGPATGMSPTGWIEYSDMIVDHTNTPYVAYAEAAAAVYNSISVKRFNSNSWNSVGSTYISGGGTDTISLAVNNNNVLYIAYRIYDDSIGGNKAVVMKFDGNTWVDVNSGALSSNVTVYSLSMDIDSHSMPYVLYGDENNERKPTVMKYNGTTWVNVGSAIDDGSVTTKNSIKLDSHDIPYMVYRKTIPGSTTIAVRKFDGSAWVDVNSSFPSSPYIKNPVIYMDHNDIPYVAYIDGDGYGYFAGVVRYNGRTWIPVGTYPVTNRMSIADVSVGLTFDSKNIPYLVYADDTKSNKCSVIKYVDGAWISAGSSSFSSGGLRSWTPSISIDEHDTPFVAYTDDASENEQKVIVKKLIAKYNVLENSTFVTNITAKDDENDTITYDINSRDSSHFTINDLTGELSFDPAPDYEAPQSESGINIYELVVTASDYSNFDSKWVQVLVTDDPDTDDDGIEDSQDPDADDDGMPNDYEVSHGFDPLNANDANEDYDNDGFTNLEEYNAGTDPKDDTSYPDVPQDPHSYLPAVIMYLLN